VDLINDSQTTVSTRLPVSSYDASVIEWFSTRVLECDTNLGKLERYPYSAEVSLLQVTPLRAERQ
jgi:hypothetical protein